MVSSCSAYNCENRKVKGDCLKWHRFPIYKDELCKRWVAAMRRDRFVATSTCILCGKHFLPSDYKFLNSSRLKDDVVPSVFEFPEHLEKNAVVRPPPKKRLLETSGDTHETPVKKIKVPPKSPTKEELKLLLKSKNDKLKTLQQKLRRKEKKVASLKDRIQDMKDKQLVGPVAATQLEEAFSGLSLIHIKDNGGFVYPSKDVVKVLEVCEKFFKIVICGDSYDPKINSTKRIKQIMRHHILMEIPDNIFSSLNECIFENDHISEDLHVTQITKAIIDNYLDIRLFRYAQFYTENVLKKNKIGIRQQSNKLVLFQGL